MAHERKHGTAAGTEHQSPTKYWASLTWDDLVDWAGNRSVSRGRTYQRQGRVQDLAMSEDGRLLASVTGGDRYAVSVWHEPGKKRADAIQSRCTCPVGSNGCKHAVAVVAAYLELVAHEAEVPAADPEDPRWAKLAGNDSDVDMDDDGEIDSNAEEEEAPSSNARRQPRKAWDEKIRKHIDAKGREELAALVWSLTERFPELREEFRERIALSEGNVDRLVTLARQEIDRVTSEAGWRNNWTGDGYTPDFSRLIHRLERMVELGHADAVVRLGQEIIKRGMKQVEQSQDEGETASALGECFPVIFKAAVESSLSPMQKLLFAIDAHLQDDYSVIGDDDADVVLGGRFQPADWSAVADELARRLKTEPKGRGDFHRNYQRDQISNWLVYALKKAGRDDEMPAVYEDEARTTGSYERLVNFLLDQKRYDDAERWAAEGILKTCEKLPGIASNLGKSMGELARLRSRWEVVAAHAAWQFFEGPSSNTFDQLMTAAAKANCQDEVRRLALLFLETGVSPISLAISQRGDRRVAASTGWPLPVPDYLLPLLKSEGRARTAARPHYDVLIDMAIAEKRPDNVLQWYDKMCADQKQSRGISSWFGPSDYADRVAEAVAQSHPHRSFDIYRQHVNDNLTQAHLSAYEAAATYLGKMRPILKSLNRENEWTQLLADIRLRYRNRPRFMEILDRLDSRPILQALRTRR